MSLLNSIAHILNVLHGNLKGSSRLLEVRRTPTSRRARVSLALLPTRPRHPWRG